MKLVSETEASPRNSTGVSQDRCYYCDRGLETNDRALLVEEELGRVFCSEECIASSFAPEIERLEKDYFNHLSPTDLTGEEREKAAHLRWVTLEEPDEVWRVKQQNGDDHYVLISEFTPGDYPIWLVCICLFLRGEPSFLFLAFPTKNAAMVDHYRKGERVEWTKRAPSNAQAGGEQVVDGLADSAPASWSEYSEGKQGDIPTSDHAKYEGYLDPTLEEPDEVWSQSGESRVYHFIKRFIENGVDLFYIVIARETEDEAQIEIQDAFPTRDSHTVQKFRKGTQEVGEDDLGASARVVH